MLRFIRKVLRPRWRAPLACVANEPRIVLLASGEQTRWSGIGAKQLAPIDGEPLLLRTLRQFQSQLAARAVVVTPSREIAQAVGEHADVLELPAEQRRWTVETALYSAAAWGDPTWLLLGDVYWTDAAVRQINRVAPSDPPRYFVSRGFRSSEKIFRIWRCQGRPNAPKRWDEILGLWFRRSHRQQIADCLYHALVAAERGGRGKLWESYRSLCGFPLERHRLEKRHRWDIDDESTDFDTVEEYLSFADGPSRRAA